MSRGILSIALALAFCRTAAAEQFVNGIFAGAARVTCDYGPRIHPVNDVWHFHQGIDFAPVSGDAKAAIRAVEAGTFLGIKYEDGAGWTAKIRRSDGKVWWYCHTFEGLKNALTAATPIQRGDFKLHEGTKGIHFVERVSTKTFFRPDEAISVGTEFVPMGDSGVGTGPHLHLTIEEELDDHRANPLAVLSHTAGTFTVGFSRPSQNEFMTTGSRY